MAQRDELDEQGAVDASDVAAAQASEEAVYDESAPVNDPRASTERVGLNETALGRKVPPPGSEGQSALDAADG